MKFGTHMYYGREHKPIENHLDMFNNSIDFVQLSTLIRLGSLLIVQKYMMKYIWQAAKVLLCENSELLHNTGTRSNKETSV